MMTHGVAVRTSDRADEPRARGAPLPQALLTPIVRPRDPRAMRGGPRYAGTMANPSADPFDLQRFVAAQEPLYAQVTAELAAGAKTSHWMWFVFPQLRGLGRSGTALNFGITGLDEARDYLQHPVLGARLRQCCSLLLGVQGRSAPQIFGAIDTLKLRSCLTLFERAAPGEPLFAQLLVKYYGGERDVATLQLLD